MTNPKILIGSDYPVPGLPVVGGIPRSIHTIVQELIKIVPGYEFHICTFSNEVKSSTEVQSDNLFIHYINLPLLNRPNLIPEFVTTGIFKKYILKIQPDLVHAQGIGKQYAYAALERNPESSLITVHGIIQEESKHWNGSLRKYCAISQCRMERDILNNARNIIAVSPYVKRVIQSQTHATISVITNPVDNQFFSVKKEELPNRLLFVGGIEERKGLDTLIRALSLIRKTSSDIELHIVGGIRRRVYYQKILELIKTLNLEKNVVFCGHISDKQLLDEYANATIFVLPSYEESQGIAILEAMATGTPVVATRVGGIPDIIQDEVNGCLIDCGNELQLAEIIESLLQEKKRRQQISLTGKKMVSEYSSEKIARQHIQVYNNLLYNSSKE